MSRRGYSYERSTEVWLCKIFEQDIKSDFTSRAFRTASSGAIISCKGDLRSHKVPWLEDLVLECKHLSQYTKKLGACFHLYLDLLEKIHKEAHECHSTPILTFGFKHVHTHKGEGRVQFAIPEPAFQRWFLAAGSPKVDIITNELIPFYERKRKYYLVAHDMLWKYAGETENITVFPIKCLYDQTWLVISRRHLERLLVAVRENYKQKGKTNVDSTSVG